MLTAAVIVAAATGMGAVIAALIGYADRAIRAQEHRPRADRTFEKSYYAPHVCDDSLEHATGRLAVEHACAEALGQLPHQTKDTK